MCNSEVSYGNSNTSKGESLVACVDSTAQQIANTGLGVDGIKEYSKDQGILGIMVGYEHMQPVWKDDCLHVDTMHGDLALEINQSWELEVGFTSAQIVDLQGRLKQNQKFWSEVLNAPNLVQRVTTTVYAFSIRARQPQ